MFVCIQQIIVLHCSNVHWAPPPHSHTHTYPHIQHKHIHCKKPTEARNVLAFHGCGLNAVCMDPTTIGEPLIETNGYTNATYATKKSYKPAAEEWRRKNILANVPLRVSEGWTWRQSIAPPTIEGDTFWSHYKNGSLYQTVEYLHVDFLL